MPFNNTNGFIPRTFKEIEQDYQDSSQDAFPNEDFSDYKNGDLYLAHYADMQQTLKLENNLVGIEESFFTWIANETNQIKLSEIGTQNGILKALHPFVNNKQVISITPEPGIIRIYGDFIDTEESPADWKQIAQAIFKAKGAGIFTQNGLGKTDTNPAPKSNEDNKIESVVDVSGMVTNIYFSVVKPKECWIRIHYIPSNTNLQVLNSQAILAEAFLKNLEKIDLFGNPIYSIGKDFEPEKYLDPSEHPFASDFIIGWSLTGEENSYDENIRAAKEGELLTFDIKRITVGVINGTDNKL